MIRAGDYGSVLHCLKAARAAGTDDADRVATAMRDMHLARVKAPADSKAPWDYFEIVRTISPEAAGHSAFNVSISDHSVELGTFTATP